MEAVNCMVFLQSWVYHATNKTSPLKTFSRVEYVTFKKKDTVTSLSEITKSWVKATSVKKKQDGSK